MYLRYNTFKDFVQILKGRITSLPAVKRMMTTNDTYY